jgi:nucleoside-diphosphate kinase
MDRTLILVKPDGVARRLVGRIISRLEEKGLFLAALKVVRLDPERARGMYSVHEGKDFYEPLVRYMTSGPVAAVVVEGRGAVEIVRALCGPTFGSNAPAGTIRGDFAVSNRYNIVHASDSPESFKRECRFFFRDDEIVAPERSSFDWIFDTSSGDVI